jgi:hypothetical protein
LSDGLPQRGQASGSMAGELVSLVKLSETFAGSFGKSNSPLIIFFAVFVILAIRYLHLRHKSVNALTVHDDAPVRRHNAATFTDAATEPAEADILRINSIVNKSPPSARTKFAKVFQLRR